MQHIIGIFSLLVAFSAVKGYDDNKIVNYETLVSTMESFTRENVTSFAQILFDIPRFQIIVGARDYLYRLSLEGLRVLEETYWPAKQVTINTCRQKGQTEEDCRNFIKVLLIHNNRVFACGTNAFSPECTWRDINTLSFVAGWENGVAKCPYSPHTNSTALITMRGDYYIASALDFSAKDYAICRIMGKGPLLRTVQYDPKWLNEPSFIASYEIGNFTYFFFREVAVEYINCGKIIYSRVGRVCKNDQGGQYILKDNWTTFLKARLNCSIPGTYPFYYNEIQGVYYLENEEIMYATFTTPENSIYGTAICAFNLTAIQKAFTGSLKYQSNPKAAWEKKTVTHEHFQCQSPGSLQYLLDSEHYQLADEAVQPIYSKPVYFKELERLGVLVVDVVPTKYNKEVHVLYVATFGGQIQKLLVLPNTSESCLIEELHIFHESSTQEIKVLKLLKDLSSLYVGTDSTILRVALHRCHRFKNKMDCLNSMDPYCGWNEYKMVCTTAPHRNPNNNHWNQKPLQCRKSNARLNGGWNHWSSWFHCPKYQSKSSEDICWCRHRECNKPIPTNGGSFCEGALVQVANCTRHGRWTEWSLWSACSQSCGPAIRIRKRFCSNPSPAYGGKNCDGMDQEEENCVHSMKCPELTKYFKTSQWSEWSPWADCSVPCGGGFQSRERTCDELHSSYRGKDCPGCNKDFRVCNMHICPEQRKSTAWTPWLYINITKDGYFEQRFRTTCRANVADPISIRVGQLKKEIRFCLEGSESCVDSAFLNTEAEWSPWSEWSACSVSCGFGVQHRIRTCDSPTFPSAAFDCEGNSKMERKCELLPCEEYRMWEPWTIWSQCDNHGEQHRQRICKASNHLFCIGEMEEKRLCADKDIMHFTSGSDAVVEDGVHMEHVVVAFFGGLIIGIGFGAFVMYFFKQQKVHDLSNLKSRGVDSNLYVSNSEWQLKLTKDISSKHVPHKEATIRRNCNGTLTRNLRTPLYSEESFHG